MIPRGLGPAELLRLAGHLETGSLPLPSFAGSLNRHVPAALRADAAEALRALAGAGLSGRQAAVLLQAVAMERRHSQSNLDAVELVWSGPEGPSAKSRDTGVVVRELFRKANQHVLLANYAFDRPRAKALFAPLAQRMGERPDLEVVVVVNIMRPPRGKRGSDESEPALVRRFANWFFGQVWQGQRLPQVYYDPRALVPWEADQGRASMHAKCLVLDKEQVLLTSANLTEAAQVRNIEAGVLLRNPFLASSVLAQFAALIESGDLRPVPHRLAPPAQ